MRLFDWMKAPFRPVFRLGASVAATFRNLFLTGQGLSGIGPRVAGVTVNEDTALTLPAYMGVIRALAQTVSMLPRSVYLRQSRGRQKLWRHPVAQLINHPCPAMIPMAFWETLIGWALGNGYGRALIIRDPVTLEGVEMWPIEPWRIEARWENGVLYYYWRVDQDRDGNLGRTIVLDSGDVFDLHGFGSNGMCGYSLASYGAQAIGTGLARQQYAASFFENGIWGSGTIRYPKPLSDKAYARIKQASLAEEFGGPQNSFKPIILEEGGEWQSIRLPNKEAQLIEAGTFSVLEICRLAGVPPHKVYELGRATWGNIEEMQIEWRQDSVMPWAVRIEQEAQRKLMRGGFSSALYVKHNLDGLERGDMAKRMTAHGVAIFHGIKTINEVRALEELPAMGPEADELYVQGAMAKLKDIYEPPEPPPPAAPPPPPPGDTQPGDNSGQGAEDEPAPRAEAEPVRAPVAPETEPAPETPPEADEPEIAPEADDSAATVAEPGVAAFWDALEPVFEAAARRVVRREANMLAKKREKHGEDRQRVLRWAGEWHPLQRSYLEGVFASPVASLASLAGTSAPDLTAALQEWETTGIERALADPDEDGWTEQLVASVKREALKENETCETCGT